MATIKTQVKRYHTYADFLAEAEAANPFGGQQGTIVAYCEDMHRAYFSMQNYCGDLAEAAVNDTIVFNTSTGEVMVLKMNNRSSKDVLPSALVPIAQVTEIKDEFIFTTALGVEGTPFPSYRWAQGYKVKLAFSAEQLSAGGSFSLNWMVGTTAQQVNITYAAGSTTTDIKNALLAAGLTTAQTTFTTEADYEGVSGAFVCLEYNYYTAPNASASGDVTFSEVTPLKYQVTAIADICSALGITNNCPTGQIRRKSGLASYWGGLNFEQFKAYYSVSGTTPTAPVAVVAESVVTKAAFESSEYCEDIRAAYGNYDAYLESQMVDVDNTAAAVTAVDSGEAATATLASITWTDVDGTTHPAYPAAYFAYRQYLPAGLTSAQNATLGKWHLPSLREFNWAMAPRSNALTDTPNVFVGKMKGVKMKPNQYYYWMVAQYSGNNAWYFNPYNGHLSNGSKNNSFVARPSLVLIK